eukprot:91631_1
MSLLLVVALITFASVIVFCVCRNVILPWCRTAKRREILSKKKYKKLTKLSADTSTSVVATYDEDDDDVHIDAENQMMLKRVEYSSRELEQLKLLDAAIDDDDILDSDSLGFPENDNMDLTDNDEYVSMDEATSMILRTNPQNNDPNKSIFESDTQNDNEMLMVTTNLDTNSATVTNIIPNVNSKGESNNDTGNVNIAMKKKD